MQIDAAGMAAQLAAYEIMPLENRYYNKLDKSMAKSNAMGEIRSILNQMDTWLYDYTKSNSSVTQTKTTASTDEFLNINSRNGASAANLNVFVEQVANAHQMGFATGATDSDSVFATTGIVTVEIDGEVVDLDLSLADEDGSGEVSYAEFTSYFNKEMDGKVTANLVQSGGGLSMVFSSENTGANNVFTISASTDSGVDADIESASNNPFQQAQDAVIWLGGEGTGLRMTNSSNTFENLVNGVDVTVKKANVPGETPTTITSEGDSAATLESVNEFVGLFNELMGKISGTTGSGDESTSRGVLASDPTIRGLRSQMTSIVRGEFDGTRLYELGFEIDRNGKLSVDNEKFEEVLKTTDVDSILTGKDGFFGKVEALVDTYTDRSDGLLTRNIQSLETEQSRYNDALEGLNDKYEMYYNRYLKQYTQLNQLSMSMDNISTLF